MFVQWNINEDQRNRGRDVFSNFSCPAYECVFPFDFIAHTSDDKYMPAFYTERLL